MEVGSDDLLERIEELQAAWAALTPDLNRAAGDLSRGRPPSPELVRALATARQAYEAVRREAAARLGGEPAQDLAGIRQQLESARQAQGALAILDQVLSLQPAELFAEPRRQAVSLREAVGRGGPEVEALAAGRHPLASLYRLLQPGVTPEDWHRSYLAVAEAFGTDVAVGAVRLLPSASTVPPAPAAARSAAPTEATGSVPPEAPRSDASRLSAAGTGTVAGERAVSEPAPDTVREGVSVLPRPSRLAPRVQSLVVRTERLPPVAVLRPAPADTGGRTAAEGTAPRAAGPSKAVSATEAVWGHLRGDRLSAAYHLARLAKARGCCVPNPSAIATLALGRHIRGRADPLAADLARFLEDFTEEDPPVVRVLWWAAALRPALLAPDTGAGSVLVRACPPVEALYEVGREVSRLGERRQVASAAELRGAQALATWERQYAEARQAAETWWRRARESTILYQRATQLWQGWLAPDGRIGQIFQPILADQVEQADAVLAAVERCSGRTAGEELVEQTAKQRFGPTVDIEARAKRRLVERLAQGLDRARRWAELAAARPAAVAETERLVHKLHTRLRDLAPQVEPALHGLLAAGVDAETQAEAQAAREAALLWAGRAMAELLALFEDGDLGPTLATEQILGVGLLAWPGIALDAAWSPREAEVALRALVNDPPEDDPVAAFRARVRRSDFVGAGLALKALPSSVAEEADRLEEELADAVSGFRARCRTQLDQVRDRLQMALIQRIWGEEEYARRERRLTAIERRLADPEELDLQALESELAGLERETGERAAQRRQELQDEAKRLWSAGRGGPQRPEEALRWILESIERDPIAGQELVERLRRGDAMEPASITPAVRRSAFAEFVPDGLVAAELKASSADLPSLAESAPTVHGRELLRRWAELARLRNLDLKAVSAVLQALGFRVHRLVPVRSDVVGAEVGPICDRGACPAPAFGSQAQGRYRILGYWPSVRGPVVDELLPLVDETAQRQAATIVFCFGRLSLGVRQELARAAAERRRSFLTVDHLLVIFLANWRGALLPALVACSLPFAYTMPYTIASSLVPPEMFYGRTRELEWLTNPEDGHSFVYGGRQLGKTALLRAAERRFHTPDEHRWALWIDLKAHGLDRQPARIWPLLAQELARAQVPLPEAEGKVDAEAFRSRLMAWLRAEPTRRLLLLLDEADGFLEADASERFRHTRALKELMDTTGRQVKVVFSGLHNVQRTTTQPNHPLAHLGTPIRVGPLLHNGEWREAVDLVVRPLEALGYRFEHDLLPVRIVAQCNFYPSLIQLYCYELLNHLNDPLSRSQRSGPPHTITAHDVDRVYQDQKLREAIRQRFQLTLQLDQRYEVIAYILAHDFLARERDRDAEGMDPQTIYEHALTYWREGFAGLRLFEMDSLLEEMEGLGVLRRIEGGRYVLRNPNVVLLMGTLNDIENVLLQDREPPVTFDPKTFLVTRPEEPSGRPFPLTAEQLHRLQHPTERVIAVFGCAAAGLAGVGECVGALTEGAVHTVADARSPSALRAHAKSALRRASGRRTTLLVPPEVPWTWDWLREVARFLREHAPEGSTVVFLGDERTAWRIAPDPGGLERHRPVILGPWSEAFLRDWLDRHDLSHDAGTVAHVLRVTGNWHELVLESLAVEPNVSLRLDAHLERLETIDRHDWLERFGLAPASAPRAGFSALALAAANGQIEAWELDELAQSRGLEPVEVRRALTWAELLGLAVRDGPASWRLDPFVCRLLGAAQP